METCIRGFSFMPDNKIDVVDLKFVESEELERTWKAARRERLKHQEQKIWEEFVKEEDIVRSLLKEIIKKHISIEQVPTIVDDPYQFVERLPQECIKELLDAELQKMRQEKMEELEQKEPQPQPQVEPEPPVNQHVVTFVEDSEEDTLNIFDDDRDDDVSGPEDEVLNDSMSPPITVRERDEPSTDKASIEEKSSNENVTDVIEGSIYCAKIKDLRMKIVDELNNIIGSLSVVPILQLEPSVLEGAGRRAREFSARYQRVHLYQIQRQISDVERNNTKSLPYAARTHYQAQLGRVASLHNNILHALQVFHKSVPQTLCMCESRECLGSLCASLRRAGDAGCAARPLGLRAAHALYQDSVTETTDKMVEALDDYTAKITDYINSTENTSVSVSRKSKVNSKKSVGTWSRSGKSLMSTTEARLSMYSLDTRITMNRSSSSKEYSSGTSKRQASAVMTKPPAQKEDVHSKGAKKSPGSRRPLMRAPCSQPRPPPPTDHDLRTLVETVACASSHISREASPMVSPKSKNATPRRSIRETTPRKTINRKSLNNTPRSKGWKAPQQTNDGKETSRSLSEPKGETPRNIDVEPSRSARKSSAKETEDTKAVMGERDRAHNNVKIENTYHDDVTEREKVRKEKEKSPDRQSNPANLEVTRLLRQLCGGDAGGSRSERVSGTKNAQLLCVSGGSPRQPSTPQLLRILEETIQKKAPKQLFPKPLSPRDKERYRMTFNIPESTLDCLFQYRTKFIQHMLTSPMYANSSVGKPWEKIGRVSEQIINELLLNCAKDMELHNVIKDLYKRETS